MSLNGGTNSLTGTTTTHAVSSGFVVDHTRICSRLPSIPTMETCPCRHRICRSSRIRAYIFHLKRLRAGKRVAVVRATSRALCKEAASLGSIIPTLFILKDPEQTLNVLLAGGRWAGPAIVHGVGRQRQRAGCICAAECDAGGQPVAAACIAPQQYR